MLYCEILDEDYAYERQVRNRALDIARDLISRAAEPQTFGAITAVNGALPISYMRTTIPNLIVGFSGSGIWLPSAIVIDLHKQAVTITNDINFIILYPYPSYFFRLLPPTLKRAVSVASRVLPKYGHDLASCIRNDLSTFQHEFIHYDDAMRAKQKGGQVSSSLGRTAGYYYNSPIERNTYYQEIFFSLDKEDDAWFQRPFNAVLQDAFKKMRRSFVRNLDEPNRKRLIARFYKVWLEKQKN